jgi:hypothetical protein
MGRWWRARSWEQKPGLITLFVTILGSLVIPFYLDQRGGAAHHHHGAAGHGVVGDRHDPGRRGRAADAGRQGPPLPVVPHAHSIAHTQYGSSTATEYDLSRTVGFGRAVDLRVPVTGVLRLRLVVTPLNPEFPRIYSTWGDARVLGDPDKVPPAT